MPGASDREVPFRSPLREIIRGRSEGLEPLGTGPFPLLIF
jgi:hypothetical protein